MTNPRNFYDRVLDEVCNRLLNEIPAYYKYHSLRHTLDVIEMTIKIGHGENLPENEIDLLKVAALFHDTGYLKERKNHEQHSCEVFEEYADKYGFNKEYYPFVKNCIMATCIPQRPSTIHERVLCDADLDYLGRTDFHEIAEGLFEEFIACGDIQNREQWNHLQVKFLGNIIYHTDYSKKHRGPQLAINLSQIQTLI